MPYKHNADRRRHIPKMSFKVRNWPAYEAGLRRRGSLTLWIEDAALGDWQRAWFKARSHGEAGLALPGRMMAPSRFQRWCEYGSRCWRSSEAARE